VRWVFWISVGWITYAYVGYALVLRVLAASRPRPVVRADVHPRVSVIVTVHDGAREIGGKLEDLLEQEYPPDRLEILVADDGSGDGTDRLVKEQFAERGVRLVRQEHRGGKERAQQAAVAVARGEVLVFTDVGTRLDGGGIAAIVRSFADPTVGCVSSEDRLLGPEGRPAGGERGYVGYEMGLRRLESRVGSIVGLSGSLFGARREVCADFSDRLASDFRIALVAVRLGYRAVADEGAVGYYRDAGAKTSEFARKVRTVVRGLTVLFAERELLNPFRHGLFSWQLFSHKLTRWVVPFAMLAALAASGVSSPRAPFFAVAFALQAAGYAAAGLVALFPVLARLPLARALRYLVEVNLAILVAWARFLRGDRIVAWIPSAR
jgi:cellulose synthase/poly-beta-1,6-N-acetylglucosamine synthase-like glycosyltransferase